MKNDSIRIDGMYAAVCYQFKTPLVIEEVDILNPRAGEVKVEIAACAICHSDIHYMDGAWQGSLPAVYGHEAAGRVVEVGPGVTHVKPGDHVVVTLIRYCGECHFCRLGHPTLCEADFSSDRKSPIRTGHGAYLHQAMYTGAFAEFVVVHRSQVIKIPVDMLLAQASLLACGVLTGVGAVTNAARVPFGSSVVVIGAGGVGLNSLQGAKLCGAQPIIAIDLIDSKLSAATSFGATHTINPVQDDAATAVKEITRGHGADYVFVTVGSAAAMEQGLKLLNAAGMLVVVGMTASGVKLSLEAVDLAATAQRIIGCRMGSSRPHIDIPVLVQLYQQGRLKLDELISGRYPLTQINQAIEVVKQGHALRNVITFEAELS